MGKYRNDRFIVEKLLIWREEEEYRQNVMVLIERSG